MRWCLKPPDFDARKKYPVLVYVYGEPAGQTVLDRWAGKRHLWHLMLAQRGYLVVSIDNRGTSAPARPGLAQIDLQASRHPRPGRPGRRPARHLRGQAVSWTASGSAVWGWSGGGSMSLNAIFRHPDLYQTAMAVAPVANHALLRQHLSGALHGPAGGQRRGLPRRLARSPTPHKLKGNLLLVHGTGDDNCHYQGTEALIDELIAHDKHFTMMAYPNRSHGISEGANTTRHLYGLLARYLERHTPPGARERVTPVLRPWAETLGPLHGLMRADPLGRVVGQRSAAELSSRRFKSRTISVEGWNVSIDERLLDGEHAAIGTQAAMLLRRQLQAIRLIVPADKVRALAEGHDPTRPVPRSPAVAAVPPRRRLAQRERLPRDLVKCVHIPDARYFNDRRFQHQQPWVMMHELAHAYHDQVLGFDDPRDHRRLESSRRAVGTTRCCTIDGKKRRHYGLTNHEEFFAEMTESYFGERLLPVQPGRTAPRRAGDFPSVGEDLGEDGVVPGSRETFVGHRGGVFMPAASHLPAPGGERTPRRTPRPATRRDRTGPARSGRSRLARVPGRSIASETLDYQSGGVS